MLQILSVICHIITVNAHIFTLFKIDLSHGVFNLWNFFFVLFILQMLPTTLTLKGLFSCMSSHNVSYSLTKPVALPTALRSAIRRECRMAGQGQ